MKNRNTLATAIQKKSSMLCVGLDTNPALIPLQIRHDFDDPILEFNRQIINGTKEHCIAYKFNIAFYESQGQRGWDSLRESLKLIPKDILTIADAKRGDIGNTSAQYADAFFSEFEFDAITVSPYMGEDSVRPFLEYEDKWVIILGLTSNRGSSDFQLQKLPDNRYLFEHVIERCAQWGTPDNIMFVIGATQTDYLKRAREIAPDHFFLMPGIGAQGGDLHNTLRYGVNDHYGLLINSSRGIIYAEGPGTLQENARTEAKVINRSVAMLIDFDRL